MNVKEQHGEGRSEQGEVLPALPQSRKDADFGLRYSGTVC